MITKIGMMMSCTGTTRPPMNASRIQLRPRKSNRASPYDARQARIVLNKTPNEVTIRLFIEARCRFAVSHALR